MSAVALMALATGCSDEAESPIAPSVLPSLRIEELVTSMSADGVQAVVRPGAAPAPSGGPASSVSGNDTIVNGGTLAAGVSSGSPFQTVYLYVGSNTVGLVTSAPGGVDGYYELRLPAAQASAATLLAFAQAIPLSSLDLLFAVEDASGRVGPYARLSTTVTSVGTGDVQVTLSWDADSDVDLHVVDPAGEEIYYANRRSASGGELDLDSNAACNVDGVRNENITWPTGLAPRGTYTVRVDYWSSCGVPRTNYTVRINVGGSVQLFEGSFTGSGDQGGRGSGRLITTFERQTGPTAAAAPAGAALSTMRGKTPVLSPR